VRAATAGRVGRRWPKALAPSARRVDHAPRRGFLKRVVRGKTFRCRRGAFADRDRCRSKFFQITSHGGPSAKNKNISYPRSDAFAWTLPLENVIDRATDFGDVWRGGGTPTSRRGDD
jgi:hypothetical protein